MKQYHELVPGKIYMGGADDVQAMVDLDGVKVIVDLREESEGCASSDESVTWLQKPLNDAAESEQTDNLKEAIQAVVGAFHSGQKVAVHCGGGKGRTGTVAYGTLLELGLASTIDEAEQKAQQIRSVLNIKSAQRSALEKIYS